MDETPNTPKAIDPVLIVVLVGLIMPLVQALADGYQDSDLPIIGRQAGRALKLALGDAAESQVLAVGEKIGEVLDAVMDELES
jgi:hypothetical protein